MNKIIISNSIFENNKNIFIKYRIPIEIYHYESEYHLKLFDAIRSEVDEAVEKIRRIEFSSHLKSWKNHGRTYADNVYTNYHNFYNILGFDNPIIQKFRDEFIFPCFKKYIKNNLSIDVNEIHTKCWMNKLDKYEFIDVHNHSLFENVFSAHYDLMIPEDSTSGTLYHSPVANENFRHKKNFTGQLAIFPGFLKHSTSMNRSDQPRYTLGMDFMVNYSVYTDEDEFNEKSLMGIKFFDLSKIT